MPESTPERGYTIAQASTITGLSRRRLEYLAQTGLVCPSLRRPGGKRRYYSFFELVELRTIARLRGAGEERISLQQVRRVVRELEKVRDRPLRSCTLLSDGGKIFWLEEDSKALIDVLGQWQVVLAVSLHGLEWEVRRELHRLDLPAPPPREDQLVLGELQVA